MAKERSGKSQPPKGKPSGAAKDDITDRYTSGEDEIGPHVPVRHPNRNTGKKHESSRNPADDQDSRHDPHAIAEPAT
ncbi:MAG TPA: hypothetical protein VFZ42_13545, partial [Chitinophagaceae bacterium]